MSGETMREAVARAIARGLGDEFSNAFRNKERWTAKRGMSGGRFRDVNEPYQSDYLDAADAAIRTVLERLREVTPAMEAAGDALQPRYPFSTEIKESADCDVIWQAMLDAAAREVIRDPAPSGPST